jgi:hypothetical protein
VAGGTVAKLSILIDESNQSSQIEIGLYSENFGHPGKLLTHGDLDSPTPGWHTVTVGPAGVSKGEPYWLAVVSKTPGVPVTFKADAAAPSGFSEATADKLTSLPPNWVSGSSRAPDAPRICAYAAP